MTSWQPKKGRPRREVGDHLRTRMWFQHVEQVSQNSAYKLEREFDPGTARRTASGTIQLSGKWQRYRTGTHNPSADLVDRVERRYPGTSDLFHSELWMLANYEVHTPEKLAQIIEKRSPQLMNELRIRVDLAQEPELTGLPQIIDSLFRSGTLADLTALIAAKRYLVRHDINDGHLKIMDSEVDEELSAPIYLLLMLHLGFQPLSFVAVDLYDHLSDVLSGLPDSNEQPHVETVIRSIHRALHIARTAGMINRNRLNRFYFGLWITRRISRCGYAGSELMTDTELLADLRAAQTEMKTRLRNYKRRFSVSVTRMLIQHGVITERSE